MRMQRLFPAFVLILLMAATLSAQNNTIRGKVRSTNGRTVNNAIVELRQTGGAMIGQAVTRNDGDFTFANLPPDEYEISITVAGFEPVVQRVRFNHPPSERFNEVLNIEIPIRPLRDPSVPTPSTNFVQDVPKAARDAYEKAMSRLREGKSGEAVFLLREAIGIFGDYFNALLALGNELYRTGKYQDALETLERARQVNDRESAVYHLFGLVMIKQQKFAVAEYAFREAVRLNSNNPAARFGRALSLIELAFRNADVAQRNADMAEAEKELKEAWELSGKRMTAIYLQRARIYERRGEKEAAARELESYLKAEPDSKDASAIRQAILKLREAKK
ncbi:MAG TPA: carboxypeptidase regulatory-like domain-containing protein [Blastocatellia bacterium]|nr:carboxypeptidase regulatory-like domain-containing protein [Blastocatellia bacterium]